MQTPSSGWGFPGDTPPCPPGSAPGPPAPPPSAAAAAGRGRAAPSEWLRRGWGKLRRPVAFLCCRWLDRFNKSLFFFLSSLSLSSGTLAEASIHCCRVRKRHRRSQRKRPPAVSRAPRRPTPEKEPAFGRAASARLGASLPASLPPQLLRGD